MLLPLRRPWAGCRLDLDFTRIDTEAFEVCPDESIDYAVMEKTSDAVVFPMDAGWNDIGSWSSLWDVSDRDVSGNATYGDVLLHATANSYVRADDKLVALLGLKMWWCATKDATLVAHKDHVQDAKVIASKIKGEDGLNGSFIVKCIDLGESMTRLIVVSVIKQSE